MRTMNENNVVYNNHRRYIVQVFVGTLSQCYEALSVEASKQTSSEEIVACIVKRLSLESRNGYELAEVIKDALGRECKERRLAATECPVAVMLLWPQMSAMQQQYYSFHLREKYSETDNQPTERFGIEDQQLLEDYYYRFLYKPQDREYPDLCQLPDLNEQTLLDNLRARFNAGHIYTYVGSILIAVNPFKFHPIYNPKYVKLYQNIRNYQNGPELPPHIFAIADSAYHSMLKEKRNQCVVISGESGSGKTESTNFLLHHLTALSHKGCHGSGVEQTILSAGPVLEAFGNAKTAHNNNSSRFGKFIQVNYKENGMVHGAVVQKYLLEKSRICSQGNNERNYHVFYYLLGGASESEVETLHLKNVESYNYLNRSGCYALENIDEKYEFSRLKQSMEIVGFPAEKQRRLFSVLSAVLLLGNVKFQPKKLTYHHDEAVSVTNPEIVSLISKLLHVKEETLLAALTAKRARASGETFVINYKFNEAIAARDAIAKCLYGALFDWIVLQVNHSLLSKNDTLKVHQGNSIGVLDIFGFEDFGNNSFEQFCINFANEHLQYYFNQHVFKYEQEEYRREGINWTDITFLDNSGCLQLIEGKPNGLLCVLDDHCNFPATTNETLLQKFNCVHKDNPFYEVPQRKENAFMVRHYAGKVKYQISEMREKNLDLMRQDIVSVLKNSSMAFVRELVGADPVAVFRWAILRAFFRAYFAFNNCGQRQRQLRDGCKNTLFQNRFRNHIPNDNLIRLYARFNRDAMVSSNANRYNKSAIEVSMPNNAFLKRHADQRITSVKADFYLAQTQKRKNNFLVASNDEPEMNEKLGKLDNSEKAVFERATRIVMKNKSFRPRDRANKGLKNLQSVKTLAGRTQGSTGATTNTLSGKARKQPLTVSAQFQYSLHSLMETLNQANPFFIRCIKSNSEKVANLFDEETVQRQLRYTGMLETVRIRQAGYNVRLTYEEFVRKYRILLPKDLASTKSDVQDFLLASSIDSENYQTGVTKVFLRESEKSNLDLKLHQQIVNSILTLQRWFRVVIERRRFLKIKGAVTTLQSWWRMVSAQRMANHLRQCNAAATIQSFWRGQKVATWYRKLKSGVIGFQAHARGYLTRRNVAEYRTAKSKSRYPSESRGSFSKSMESSQEDLYVNTESSESRRPSETDTMPFGYSDDSQFTNDFTRPLLSRNYPKRSYTKYKKKSERKYRSSVFVDQPEKPASRKGSGDSISSQKSCDSQLYSIVPSKETIQKASKQIKAFMGTSSSKKSEAPGISIASDSDIEDNLPLNWKQPEDKPKPLPHRSAHLSEPVPPARIARRPPNPSTSCAVEPPKALYSSDVASLLDKQYISTNTSQSDSNYLRVCNTPKRRNSDPSATSQIIRTGEEVLDVNEPRMPKMSVTQSPSYELLTWKGTTSFTIAGHNFRKVNRFSKDDRCACCSQPMDAFITQGHKCSDCKQLFHTKCIQNGGVLRNGCPHQASADSKKLHKRIRQTSSDKSHALAGSSGIGQVAGQFNLTGTSEFTDRTDKIISDVIELKKMQDFINEKLYKMNEEKKSQVDVIFNEALREFKDNLVSVFSVITQEPNLLNIRYQDLIANFSQVVEIVCKKSGASDDFPVTLYVNAFRGFMNEFMTLYRDVEKEKPATKLKKKKEKEKKNNDIIFANHVFQLNIINIPTACELCTSFFLWPLERSLVCRNCKLTVHKKCYSRVTVECGKDARIAAVTPDAVAYNPNYANRVFGVELRRLVTKDEKVPLVVERLITTVEMYGIYSEGIYRKSGRTSKVRELKNVIEQNDLDDIQLDKYQAHVLTSVLKAFLREMPEPLLTYECYDDFIRAAQLSEDRVSTLFSILKKLPKLHYDLMERLVFHLARVALHEEANRMNCASLAIVFAPCILRTDKVVPAQNSLDDIEHQTLCIKVIIGEQLEKVRITLKDIDTLDNACHTASYRLSSIRSSKHFMSPVEEQPQNMDNEEELLMDQINDIKREKDLLTSNLPSLRRATSDDDLLLSADDGSIDDVDGASIADAMPSTSEENSGENECIESGCQITKRHNAETGTVTISPYLNVSDDEDPIMV